MNNRKVAMSVAAVLAALAAVVALTAGAAGSVPAAPKILCGAHEQTATVTSYGMRYVINSGQFGGHYECVTYGTRPGFKVTKSFGGCAPSHVQAFPDIGAQFTPRRISSLKNPRVSFAYRTNHAPGGWNAAIEMWTNKTPRLGTPATGALPPCQSRPGGPGGGGHDNGAEVMIWLARQNIYLDNHKFPVLRIDGADWWLQTWRAHVVTAHGLVWWNYTHFLRVHPVTSVTRLPLVPFYRALEKRGLLSPSWYLEGMQGGFEVYAQGQGLETTWFRAMP